MCLSVIGASIQAWWAWKWDGWRSSSQKSTRTVQTITTCSVVICLHNEEERASTLLEEFNPALDVANHAGLKANIVVVNHGSTDQTAVLLRQAVAADSRWILVEIPRTRASKKEALEAGIAASSGEVLLVTDADCTPVDASWILHMTRGAFANWDVHIGLSLPRHSDSTWLAQIQKLEARRLAQRATGAAWAGKPYLGFGRNMAFTKEMWERVGGMERHAHLPSGDDDLWLQEAVGCGARVAVATNREAQTESIWPATWNSWRMQKSRHFTASKAYPAKLLLRLGLPSIGWLLLVMGVVHNPSGTSVSLLALAFILRTLTFGMFLHQAGQPWREGWELVLEPIVSAFRTWALWKSSTSESTPWK